MASRESYVIDCDACPVQHTEACADCVVSYVCDRTPGESLVVDIVELRALRMLSEGGLVPGLRHPMGVRR
jgi:hypothetical protein